MITSTINLTIFIIMIIIYLNEMRNISMFIFNFNYIKDFSKIIMEQKCNNIYCEAETDRYNIAKNSYKLLLPNDIFNSKTYIIFTFMLSILIYIYYHYILIHDIIDSQKIYPYYLLHILLFATILGMIIFRYVPNEEAGYLNYFKNTDRGIFIGLGFVIGISILVLLSFLIKPKKDRHNSTYIIIPCFMLSIILLLNLLNIILTFRNNTKPILKTKELLWSLNKSLKYEIKEYKSKDLGMNGTKEPFKPSTESDKLILTESNKLNLEQELRTMESLSATLEKGKIKTKENIQYILNILNAFSELSKIKFKNLVFNDTNKGYINTLKETFRTNNEKFNKSNPNESKISEISLIYDKEVKIPSYYEGTEHFINANTNNDEYIYTADISYDNPNLFYEKYWDISEKNMYQIPQFLWEYEYFTPPMFLGYKPNLFKILIFVIIFIFIAAAIIFTYSPIYFELYNILLPLITFAILIIYILIFICFNTWFNKYVVYKCLDCSYKRSLNKLNNIVTPYIRLYDNKIIKGNKNYTHHYIISNVFYSILCGYIKLNKNTVDGSSTKPINENTDNKKYYDITKINSNRLKFANMNSNILNNDNEFREYYKAKFKDVYNKDYTDTLANSLYNVFPHIFNTTVKSSITDETSINKYFTDIISKDNNVKNIFKIIKKCLNLFEENKFNNNLIYYNNRENKNKDINIDIYNKFKFYKDNDKIIPYKFILKLTTYKEFEEFIKLPADENTRIDKFIEEEIENVLDDNNDVSQSSDMEKEQDKYLLKIIAKYLLILGHINVNRIEYNETKNVNNAAIGRSVNNEEKRILTNNLNTKLKEIYEKKTYNLYKLFSNTLFKDTYEIDDTFSFIIDEKLIITTKEYKVLTYIYNFLETKYVSISSDDNNNYLANIIKSINNKINNDDKIFINKNKSAQYVFRENIDKMNNPNDYDDDQQILNIANNVSTIDFGFAYGFNMLILILYYYFILKKY